VAAASEKTSETEGGAPKCGATNKRNGKPCRMTRGFRTDHPGSGHCYLHGGASPNGEKHAARIAAERLGAKLELAPHDALLDALYRQAAIVAFYAGRVAALDDTALIVEPTRIRRDQDGDTTIDRSNDAGVNVWVRLYSEAVLQQAKLAKAAVDAGVAERHVRIVEAHAELFARALDAILGDPDLALTPDQLAAATPVVRRHLVLLEGGRAA
jgi:hypothetical protein